MSYTSILVTSAQDRCMNSERILPSCNTSSDNNLILHQGLEKNFRSIFKDFGLYVLCPFIYLYDSQMDRQHRLK